MLGAWALSAGGVVPVTGGMRTAGMAMWLLLRVGPGLGFLVSVVVFYYAWAVHPSDLPKTLSRAVRLLRRNRLVGATLLSCALPLLLRPATAIQPFAAGLAVAAIVTILGSVLLVVANRERARVVRWVKASSRFPHPSTIECHGRVLEYHRRRFNDDWEVPQSVRSVVVSGSFAAQARFSATMRKTVGILLGLVASAFVPRVVIWFASGAAEPAPWNAFLLMVPLTGAVASAFLVGSAGKYEALATDYARISELPRTQNFTYAVAGRATPIARLRSMRSTY
ncbi:hypothetical protein GCM10009619_25460 [Williamsia maris]